MVELIRKCLPESGSSISSLGFKAQRMLCLESTATMRTRRKRTADTHPKKTISGLINAFPSHSLLISPLSSSSLASLPSHSSLPTLRFFFGLSSRSRARVAAAASSSGVQNGHSGTRDEKTSGSMAVPGMRRRQMRQEAVAKEPVRRAPGDRRAAQAP